MLINSNITWRKQYHKKAIAALKCIVSTHLESMPEVLTLPASEKICMFEFGGSQHTSGIAMIVATPSGFPNTSIVLSNRKVNGLHVCSKVWVSCLIGVASHQYGIINAGIYRITDIKQLVEDNVDSMVVTAKLVSGATNLSSYQSDMHTWYKHSECKYPGIRKLAHSLIDKLLNYKCVNPTYIEPFKLLRRYTGKDPEFTKLLLRTDLDVTEYVSPDVPQYAIFNKCMKKIEEYSSYFAFEKALVTKCQELFTVHPYVYTYFCHYLKDDSLITQVFICYQQTENDILQVYRQSYMYIHSGIDKCRSYDLESYIKSNYNPTYMATILNVNGGINQLIKRIEQSKDKCVYVPLKYALCTKRYLTK